jgi:hypothetical protein
LFISFINRIIERAHIASAPLGENNEFPEPAHAAPAHAEPAHAEPAHAEPARDSVVAPSAK